MSLNLFFGLVLSAIVVASANYGYDTNPESQTVPQINHREFLPPVFSVQGVVYCKLGPKAYPIKGELISL